MPRIRSVLGWLGLGFALSSCSQTGTCEFDAAASSGGVERYALLVDATTALPLVESSATRRLESVLGDLDFAPENVCVVAGENATRGNVAGALSDVARAGRRDSARFVYLAAESAAAPDNNDDEPDGQDETLVFRGEGTVEMRDDDLASLLAEVRERSSGSVVVINAGNETTSELAFDRTVEVESRSGGDGAAFFGLDAPEEHVVIAAGRGSDAFVLDSILIESLAAAAMHTPSYLQFGRKFAMLAHNAGIAVDIGGTGGGRLLGLHRESLVTLGGGVPELTIKIRDESSFGGIDDESAGRARALLQHAGGGVTFAGENAGFELSRTAEGQFLLRGPDNRARNRFMSLDELPGIVAGHLQQRRILQLHGNGAEDLPDHEAVRIELRPIDDQLRCATGIWDPAPFGEVQDIPLCYQWFTRVQLAESSPALHITLVVLSSDGKTFVVPDTGFVVSERNFDDSAQVFGAGPPIEVVDQIIVIGSTDPVDAAAVLDGTHAAPEGTKWTVSARGFRVVANSAFVQSDELTQREYTIKNFDIRPYLPDDDSTALSRFLRKADELAKSSVADGYSYKQHDWGAATDAENLAKGIDCSRSIWYAFTRSGLPYNRSDRYLATADMVADDSWMTDRFERCSVAGDYEIGDILVYRSAERGDGHVVAVIDSGRRIAWGSHGWDGSPNIEPELQLEPDTGVEYQKIRIKKDWLRWDRGDMELKACWRYRRFAQELEDGRGAPGSKILGVTCGEDECRVERGNST